MSALLFRHVTFRIASHSACTGGIASSRMGARLAGSEESNAISASRPFYSIPFKGTVERVARRNNIPPRRPRLGRVKATRIPGLSVTVKDA